MHIAVDEFDYFHRNDTSIAYASLQTNSLEYQKFSDYLLFIGNSLRLVQGYFRGIC